MAVDGQTAEVTLSPEATFEAFYQQVRDGVFHTVLLLTRDRDSARDATDEAFARAWRDWNKVARHPNPTAWVARTALNYAKTQHRRFADEAPGLQPERLAVSAPVAAESDPGLISAIARLPEMQRKVIGLRYLAELNPGEIAEVLGIKRSTVGVHHYRGIQALRRALNAEKEGNGC
jgi:RNA polymerase sigma factor (sigma-70 family)